MNSLPKIEPMKLSIRAEPFDHPDYLFELKHDGFRSLAYIADGKCELVSRRRNFYKRFGSLSEAMAGLKVQSAILDGEIVCLDSEGRSVFYELLFKRGEPIFYAFDLLWLNGRDLRQLPLIERKRMLRSLVKRAKKNRILFADHILGWGIEFFRTVCEQNLEGIVAKLKDGVYTSAAYWLKIKAALKPFDCCSPARILVGFATEDIVGGFVHVCLQIEFLARSSRGRRPQVIELLRTGN